MASLHDVVNARPDSRHQLHREQDAASKMSLVETPQMRVQMCRKFPLAVDPPARGFSAFTEQQDTAQQQSTQ